MQRRTLLALAALAGPALMAGRALAAGSLTGTVVSVRLWADCPPALRVLLALPAGVEPRALAAWLDSPAGRAAWQAAAGGVPVHPLAVDPAPAGDAGWFGPEVLALVAGPPCPAVGCQPPPSASWNLVDAVAAGNGAAAAAARLAGHPDPAVRAAVAAARALCAATLTARNPAGLALL